MRSTIIQNCIMNTSLGIMPNIPPQVLIKTRATSGNRSPVLSSFLLLHLPWPHIPQHPAPTFLKCRCHTRLFGSQSWGGSQRWSRCLFAIIVTTQPRHPSDPAEQILLESYRWRGARFFSSGFGDGSGRSDRCGRYRQDKKARG